MPAYSNTCQDQIYKLPAELEDSQTFTGLIFLSNPLELSYIQLNCVNAREQNLANWM